MSDIERQIRDRIGTFVQELNELVRRAAVEAVRQALGGTGARPARSRRASDDGAAVGRRLPRLGKGGRRTRGQLRAVKERLVAHVAENPGQRMEQIGEAIALSTRELRRPITQLIRDGVISYQGEKRSRKYFPAGKAPRGGGRAKKAARKKR